MAKCEYWFVFLVMIMGRTEMCAGCFSSGICGGGFSCAPMPQPLCMGGCGPGYGCGRYGCYAKARARSSKTFTGAHSKQDNGEFLEVERKQLLTPDEKFYSCCVDRHLPDVCLQKCSFATYTKEGLQSMYFRFDPCPVQAAADMHFCAAQGRDHRDCCEKNGVTNTLAGNKCLVFCDQRPGNITQLDMSYLPCYERFENIKGCFWHDLSELRSSEMERRFDSL